MGSSLDSLASFKKYLLYSLGFHALVIALFLLFAKAPPPLPVPTTQVVMIRLGGGGNPNGALTQKPPAPGPVTENLPPTLPTKPAPIEKPPVPAPTRAKSKATAAPPPKESGQVVHLNPQKSVPAKPKSASNAAVPAKPKVPTAQDQEMQRALSQIQTELHQREKQQQTNPNDGTGQGKVPAFGATGGGPVAAADPGYAQYQSSVRSKIVREWIRTNSGPGEEKVLRARISVRINASGAVIAKAVQRSSGDESFDLSAMRAIERASPLPPPPEAIMSEALSEGFVVDFNSRMLGGR